MIASNITAFESSILSHDYETVRGFDRDSLKFFIFIRLYRGNGGLLWVRKLIRVSLTGHV